MVNIDELCPIQDSSDFFNRKWIFCILMDMFRGLNRFSEFQESNPNLNNFTLSQTLKYLEENGLIVKNKKDNNTTEYYLTKKGKKTNKILYELTIFSLEELNLSIYSEDIKKEILKSYKEALKM